MQFRLIVLILMGALYLGINISSHADEPVPVAAATPTPTPSPTPSPEENKELTLKSLKLISGNVEGASDRCLKCHAPTMRMIGEWGEYAKWTKDCIEKKAEPGQPEIKPQDRIDCFKKDKTDPNSLYDGKRLGLLSAGAHTSVFSKLFKDAFSPETWETEFVKFKDQVAMPKDQTNQLSEEEFATILTWVGRELPYLEKILGNAENPPKTCEVLHTQDLNTYINRMKTEGWAAKLKDKNLLMFACPKPGEPLECFKQQKDKKNTHQAAKP